MQERILLVAGVDGGATHTRAVVTAADGTIIGYGSAGPSNYDNVGVATASANIHDAVLAARRDSASVPLTAIFLGMAGVVSASDRAVVKQMAHDLAPAQTIGVDHDIRIALAGGLQGREGVVLIAGTGSSSYGRRADGRHHRTGWGYLLDDRGSGYFLGLRAMIATVMEADGRGSPTSLGGIVRDRFAFTDVDDILRLLYHDGIPVAEIASLAPLVIGAATEGDPVARGILEEGAYELSRMVETVARRLAFASPCPVTLAGGLVERPGPYRDLICGAVRQALPGAAIVDPALPPVLGAVLLAMDAAGVPPTEDVLSTLRRGARSLP
jgi:N-acetylglucosamine kinase-like BadF-type ATPase